MSNTDTSKFIIGGDWNVTTQSLDKRGGVPWKASPYRNKLISMMEEQSQLSSSENSTPCSFHQNQKQRKFAIARSSSKRVVNIKTKNAPDHKAIKLSLELSEKRRGPGLWKFNNALVDEEEYFNRIKENYPIIGEKYREMDEHRLVGVN